jgi:hypothetical protein
VGIGNAATVVDHTAGRPSVSLFADGVDFHSPLVTSDLDGKIQKADHRQGSNGTRKRREKGRKLFVMKILTSNS